MKRFAGGALVVVALATAPVAGADPQDLEPGCAPGQVAQAGECLPQAGRDPGAGPVEVLPGIPGAFPGANPNTPPGVLPLNAPVVIPLGVTPSHQPQNLPSGPTPPPVLPFAS